MERLIRKIGLLFLFLINSVLGLSQINEDSAQSEFKIGFSVYCGGARSNFNSVHQYSYSLGLPANASKEFGVGLYLGNSRKIMIPVFFLLGESGMKKGTYNSYNISGYSFHEECGASVMYNVYRKQKKILKSIFTSLGASYGIVGINSFMHGSSITQTDTTFAFNKSRVSGLLLHADLMFDLFDFVNKPQRAFGSVNFFVKFGYNFQPFKPNWKYNYTIPVVYYPTTDKNVNLGGFYFTVGFNEWLRKK